MCVSDPHISVASHAGRNPKTDLKGAELALKPVGQKQKCLQGLSVAALNGKRPGGPQRPPKVLGLRVCFELLF